MIICTSKIRPRKFYSGLWALVQYLSYFLGERKDCIIPSDFVNYVQSSPADEKELKAYERPEKHVAEKEVDVSEVNVGMLMAHIRNVILASRKRTREFFEDYDQLRSGVMSKSRFK